MKNKNSLQNKKALAGNMFAMMSATVIIIIILSIFLFFASAYQPFKKTDRENVIFESQNMAYQSLKNYLNTEVQTNDGTFLISDLVDRWAFDKAYETQLMQETENILSHSFGECYEIRIPYFNGQPYFVSGVEELGYFSIGNPNQENYAEVIIPSKLNENKAILVRLYLDNKCLGLEK